VSPPLPPPDIEGRNPRLVRITAGASLHRFYPRGLEPIFHDRSAEGRLNSPDGSYGVLYAAERARGAFAETFLRTPGRRMIDPGLHARKAYVRLEVARGITLIGFDGPGLAVLGATAEVIHGSVPYDCPQRWSAALHAHPARVDGIAYSARHDPHEICYALFDRAAVAICEKERILDLDADWFWALADVYAVARSP
jgi:hypothetical protein